ncbi:MAG: RNA methyltransferase [Chitinophagales bacterium]|nr:RNA methyltransferase [Chitinophagales bacterium]
MRKLKLEELNRQDIETFKEAPKLPVIVVLDNIRSALNIGSVFRTSDAFALEEIYLCGISATPPNREITKTAIGATESVNWSHHPDILQAIQQLKGQGYQIVGVEQTDRSILLQEWKSTSEKIAVVFGNEVDGISDEILDALDYSLEIPQYGTKHSLNVSVCAGIVLWTISEMFRR